MSPRSARHATDVAELRSQRFEGDLDVGVGHAFGHGSVLELRKARYLLFERQSSSPVPSTNRLFQSRQILVLVRPLRGGPVHRRARQGRATVVGKHHSGAVLRHIGTIRFLPTPTAASAEMPNTFA